MFPLKLWFVFVIQSFVYAGKNKVQSNTGFIIGRIPPGRFEYPELNGVFSPKEARVICEEDLSCAGFTFRGAKSLGDQSFPIAFFHFVPAVETTGKWHWSSYRVKRDYAVLQGNFRTNLSRKEPIAAAAAVADLVKTADGDKRKFKWPLPKVAAVEVDLFGGDQEVTLLSEVDFATLELRAKTDRVTVLHLGKDGVVDSRLTLDDRSCSSQTNSDLMDVETRSCFSDSNRFEKEFVAPRKPVLLKACVDVCTHLNWTLSDVANTFRDIQWEALLPGKKYVRLEQKELLQRVRTGGEEEGIITGEIGEALESDVLKFITDLDTADGGEVDSIGPKFKDFLRDLKFPGGTKTIVWNRKRDGSSFIPAAKSSDLKYTLLTGAELWLLLPTDDIRRDKFPCSEENSSEASWVNNMLPRLGQRTFYGRKIMKTRLEPGDTLYIPHGWVALGTRDSPETVAVAETAIVRQSLEEMAIALKAEDLNLVNKVLHERDDMRREWRRLSETLVQIKKGRQIKLQ